VQPDLIETVMRQLRRGPYGWFTDLPASIHFFGQPVELHVDTRPFPTEDPPAKPNRKELNLVRLILGGLSVVLSECERQYVEYNADFPELLNKVHEPHIWVSREWLGDEIPGNWSFVVGISDAPDWGIHIEFHGLQFQQIWSGD
jgi:hypothetical protein